MGIVNDKQYFGAAKILQLEEAEQAAKLAAAEAEAAKKVAEEKIRNSRVDPMHELIQKPTTAEMKDSGSRGRLLKAMKLENNKAEYLAIQTTVHELCSRVDLDFKVLYNAQPTSSLAKLFKLARRDHPHLEKFQNDWATAELVKQFLQNKRKANKKRKAGATVGTRNNKRSRFDDSDDSDGEVGEGSGSCEREIAGDDDEDLGA
ncbi:hypothetical protein DEU56DRAFT_793022 [Suillus clintonianus]|uniref:uncharacterized protein n=1 Tax=Suillus clintonianus TaxID=1904413 RepID=UPI001B862D75|nr:uncharacterized protein DEU56DRAFT_793022 [Suillus clintonianus]KAG2143021.1 hypothetical protein DEU56DRAFT_793022 [Suillus clintonianus]